MIPLAHLTIIKKGTSIKKSAEKGEGERDGKIFKKTLGFPY